MGKIFLSAVNNTLSGDIFITDHNADKLAQIKKEFSQVNLASDNAEAVAGADLIILAVKPQSFGELAAEISGKITDNAVVLSIMAGVKMEKISSALGAKKIVRAMPNLGARVGKSMTVWHGQSLTAKDLKVIKTLFQSIGQELEVKSEDFIDKATAVSGSGPGFFYYIIDNWIKAAVNLGFSEAEAKLLIMTTVDGANEVMKTDKNPGELVSQVASKGGTTEAGLRVLQTANLAALWQEVLRAAYNRASELNS